VRSWWTPTVVSYAFIATPYVCRLLRHHVCRIADVNHWCVAAGCSAPSCCNVSSNMFANVAFWMCCASDLCPRFIAKSDYDIKRLVGVYSDTTQLNSTRQREQQLTQFVGRDVTNKNTTDLAVRCSTRSVEFSWVELSCLAINTPFSGHTKTAQQRGPLYSNTVIGRLAVNGRAVTFGTARRGLGGLRPRPGLSSLYQT